MISWDKPGTIPRDNPSYPFFVLTNILITTFLAVLSAVITIISDTSIRGDLALSNPEATWLTTLYLLGVNTIVPTASWFADRFGYKTMYVIGLALFTSSSAIAAFAQNFWMIGIARAVEGIGAGFIFPVGLARVVQTLPEKRIPLGLLLYVGAAFGAGFALGLPLSGYFTQFLSWRVNFLLIVPLGMLGILFTWLIDEETERKIGPKFDLWGFLTFATFIATLLIALTYGPMLSTNDGWRSPYIISFFVIAGICLILTILIERKHENPLIPITLFKDPFFSVASIAMFLLGMSIFATGVTSMEYMIQALNYEKYVSGKTGIIYGLALAFFSILGNAALKIIPVAFMTFSGLMILVFSYFLNNELSWLTGADQVFWILFLRGVGLGLALGPTTVQGMRHVPHELNNKAATLLTFFRQVGGTYGGSLLAIITIKRQIFHAARFGEQANAQLPAYRITFHNLYSHFYNYTPDNNGLESAAQAKGKIIANIETQAYIQAINDAMIVFGYVTAIVALILAFLSIRHWWINRNKIHSHTTTPTTP